MDSSEESNQQQQANGASTEKKDRYRVYVANLPPKVTSEVLEEEFSKCAKVIGVLIPKSAKYAFVDFSTQEDANKAVAEMHQYVLNGSVLRVELGKGEPRTVPGEKSDKRKTARTKNRVIVTGLSAGLSWQDLKDVMRETGGDVTFTSIKDSVGYAEFATEEDVVRAIEKLDGTEVRGSQISVKRDDVPNRDLDRDQPKKRDRRRRDDRRRRQRSRSPHRHRGRSRERRRSRSRRSPERSRRRDRDDKDRESRRRRDSDSSGSRSPRRRQRTRSG